MLTIKLIRKCMSFFYYCWLECSKSKDRI